MKRAKLLQKINSLVSSFSSHDALIIKGFHPDLFLPLLWMLNCRVIITTSDECFSLIIKYLSSLWDDNSTVFVSEEVSVNRSPSGFISSENFFFSKAKESLSGGVDQIKTIVYGFGTELG